MNDSLFEDASIEDLLIDIFEKLLLVLYKLDQNKEKLNDL